MILESQIRELALTWQTTELNVGREYFQHLLLSGLYTMPDPKLAFRGGTALRLLFGSPRFSEDLDFTGWGRPFHIGETIRKAATETAKSGLDIQILDSYATSGGWFAKMTANIHGRTISVEWNVSLRNKAAPDTAIVLAVCALCPSYVVTSLARNILITEKIQAALERSKPRDFFDLYFILREGLCRQEILSQKKALLERLARLDSKMLEGELKLFLPKTHWPLLRQLPKVLKQEIGAF